MFLICVCVCVRVRVCVRSEPLFDVEYNQQWNHFDRPRSRRQGVPVSGGGGSGSSRLFLQLLIIVVIIIILVRPSAKLQWQDQYCSADKDD